MFLLSSCIPRRPSPVILPNLDSVAERSKPSPQRNETMKKGSSHGAIQPVTLLSFTDCLSALTRQTLAHLNGVICIMNRGDAGSAQYNYGVISLSSGDDGWFLRPWYHPAFPLVMPTFQIPASTSPLGLRHISVHAHLILFLDNESTSLVDTEVPCRRLKAGTAYNVCFGCPVIQVFPVHRPGQCSTRPCVRAVWLYR